MLKKIAITGGIATGKSTLLKILEELGFSCISCDEIVKKLYQKEEIQKKVKELFGREVYTKEGLPNTEIILKKILANPSLKKKLENLLHPEVLKEILSFFREKEKKGESICFVEVPLLFEVSWEKYFDEIWVITCSEKTQKERIKKLKWPDLFSELSRYQLPLKDKEKRANKVFSSEISKENLRKELKELLREYLKENIPL